MKKTFASAALAAMLTAGAAAASSITVSTLPGENAFGPGANFQNVKLDLSGALEGTDFDDATVAAGQFHLEGDGGFGEFFSFCVELTDGLNLPDSYDLDSMLFSDETRDELTALYNTGFHAVDDALSAAGFQVAIWEIVYDTSPAYDVTSGDFAIVTTTTVGGDVAAAATAFLADINGPTTSNYVLDFLVSDDGQDLVVAAVPLPAAGMLLLGGLGGLVMMRRKRK